MRMIWKTSRIWIGWHFFRNLLLLKGMLHWQLKLKFFNPFATKLYVSLSWKWVKKKIKTTWAPVCLTRSWLIWQFCELSRGKVFLIVNSPWGVHFSSYIFFSTSPGCFLEFVCFIEKLYLFFNDQLEDIFKIIVDR